MYKVGFIGLGRIGYNLSGNIQIVLLPIELRFKYWK